MTWEEVAARLARVLDEPVRGGPPRTPGWSSRMTWGAQGERAGPLVEKQAGAAIPAGDRDFTGVVD